MAEVFHMLMSDVVHHEYYCLSLSASVFLFSRSSLTSLPPGPDLFTVNVLRKLAN